MPSRRASRSKTSMNVLPMICRFFSGSTTPASACRNSSEASTKWRLRPRPSARNISTTARLSSLRIRPLSTCSRCSRSGPMRLAEQLGATVESTPPEASRKTDRSPTVLADRARPAPRRSAPSSTSACSRRCRARSWRSSRRRGPCRRPRGGTGSRSDGGVRADRRVAVPVAVALAEHRVAESPRTPAPTLDHRVEVAHPHRLDPAPGPRRAGDRGRCAGSAWPHSRPPCTTSPP